MDKNTLHKLVDSLPDSEVQTAGKFLEYLHFHSELPIELNDEDLAAVKEAIASADRGECISHEEVGRLMRQWATGQG